MYKKKYAIFILTAIGLLFLVRAFAEPYRISGDCMEPAFVDGHTQFALTNPGDLRKPSALSISRRISRS